MKRFAKFLLVVLAVLVLVVVAGCATKLQKDAHFYDGYSPYIPLNDYVRSDETREDYRRIDFVFDGLSGQAVPTLLARPIVKEKPFPCIIFLHGIGQKKDFLDEIAVPFVEAGFAICSFDQYTRGERDLGDVGPVKGMLALRRRAALNVIETRRLVDYLETRRDIDPDRIYLVGARFGAITGSTAAAFEPRLQAAVLMYGGGNIRKLLTSKAARAELGDATWLVAELGAFLLAPADPVKHVAEISPRPILFQNGTHDQLIPNEAAEALHNAALEPKEIIWYDSDHVGLDREQTFQVIDELIAWLVETDSARQVSN